MGCDHAQGYLLGRPLPESSANDLVRAEEWKASLPGDTRTLLKSLSA
jgi:hypothetical protein